MSSPEVENGLMPGRDFPGVETSFPEVEKGIYLVDGNN